MPPTTSSCQREGVVRLRGAAAASYELLERNLPLRAHYQARFRHVLVDEFQDTNVLQYKWLKMLAGPQTAVFAVGDDDQSIYAFRGANVGNMAAFEREFRVEKLIKLEQNYRSHAHILDCANHLIRRKREPARQGSSGPTPAPANRCASTRAASDGQEAQW